MNPFTYVWGKVRVLYGDAIGENSGSPTSTTLLGRIKTVADNIVSLSAKFNSLGQKTMANSAPITIASDQSTIPTSLISSVASLNILTSTPLGSDAEYVGSWIDTTGYSGIAVLLRTDVPSAYLGLVFERSADDTSPVMHSAKRHTIDFVEPDGLIHGELTTNLPGKWIRIRYKNGPTPQTQFSLSLKLSPWPLILTTQVSEPVDDSQQASVTKSVIHGQIGNREYHPARVTDEGALHAANFDSAGFALLNSPFHQMVTATETPVIQNSFVYNTLFVDDVVTTLTSGGTVTAASSKATLETTSTVGSKAVLESRRFLLYRPGQGNIVRVTGMFDAGHAGSLQAAGIGSAVEGFFFMQKGTTFGICRRFSSNDTTFFVAQSAWNRDTMDGSGNSSNPSALPLDPTKGQIYEIQYQWLGTGIIKFFVEAPNGNPVLVHVIEYPGTATGPSLLMPSHPIRVEATGNGTAMSGMSIICMNGCFYGPDSHAMNHRFSDENQSLTVNTTEIPVFALFSKATFNGITSRIEADLLDFTASVATRNVVFKFYRRTAVTGLTGGSFVNVDTTNSCMQVNKTATSFTSTGWRQFEARMADGASGSGTAEVDFEKTGEELFPGEYLVITAQAIVSNGATVNVALSWSEEH